MASLPTWIQKENEQKSQAARQADLAAQQQADASNFIHERGPAYWDQLASALQFKAQALEKLEGEEVCGSVSKSVTGTEHNLYIRVERRSTTHGPEFAWLNLWYIPGNDFMRCWYMDQMQPNIEFTVAKRPQLGKAVLAVFDNQKLNAAQLAEDIVRQMFERVRARQRR